MAAGMRFRNREFEAHLRNATASGLLRAGTFLHQKCRQAVSKPNTGVQVPVQRQTEGGNQKTRTIYPNPSKEGEPPRLRTGFGRQNIVINFDAQKMYVRVGVTENGMYMFWLEIGTRHILRRPWLVATLLENIVILGRLVQTGSNEVS